MNDDAAGGFQNWHKREHITQLEWQNDYSVIALSLTHLLICD